MAFRDDLLSVLSGGLPALIDGPNAGSPTPTQTNNLDQPRTVEQTPPEPQLQDKEPYLIGNYTGQQVALAGGAILLGVLGVYMIAKNI